MGEASWDRRSSAGAGPDRSAPGRAGHGEREAEDILSSDLRARIRKLELITRRSMSGAMTGAYRSSFRGSGVEFEEVRPYQPGDEVRAIDWNVTARTGEAHIKTYREERELRVHLVVDCSASMDFGTAEASKREKVAELAALVTAAAAQNGDPVSVDLVTAGDPLHLPPRSGADHVLRVLRAVMGQRDARPTARAAADEDLVETLSGLGRILRRRALVFVVGDFAFAEHGRWSAELELLSRRHDVIVAAVSDPFERELPNIGRLRLADAETGEVREVDTSSARVREHWRARATEQRASLAAAAKRARADLLELDTARPSADGLIALFQRRARSKGSAA